MRTLPIYLTCIILVLATQAFAQSESPVGLEMTESLCASLATIGPEDWVALDLDGTVVSNDHIFTYNNGLSNRLQRVLHKIGAGAHPSWVISHPLTALKSISKGSLIEECLPEVIRQLQAQGTWVFVITSRSSVFARPTLDNLLSLGISLTVPERMQQILGPGQLNGYSPTVRFRDGIFFTLGASKGKVLKRTYEIAPVKPPYIAAYDDLDKNVNAYERALTELGVPSTVYQFISDVPTFAEMWEQAEESLAEACGPMMVRKPAANK